MYGDLKEKDDSSRSALDTEKANLEASIMGYGFKANSVLTFPLVIFKEEKIPEEDDLVDILTHAITSTL